MVEITSDNFESEVLNGTKTVVLFTLPTSGHGKIMSERVATLPVRNFIVNAAACKEVCAKFGINKIPTTVVFVDNAPALVRFGLAVESELV